ncbi:hypothetical protein [Williamsia sp. CHRR-6]|uniref:hypothetical protein n=1 Tax=Williamsia sp. CHRR-6 TaxID=2835871 RepID=UPI001BDB2DC4|nr:hypothetical protein [Williamsia sp. CHRR-6]MBT0566351.1 hypothetical protein [Williamsia sp. CHRR-6]
MSAWAIALLCTSSAYLGFQAVVRFVVYPQFAAVGADEFADYEARHQTLISRVVGPLFAAQLVTGVGAVVTGPLMPALISGAGVLVVLALTAGAAVPAHSRLSEGFDAPTHRRLLRIDLLRLLAASVTVAGAIWFATAS